MNQCDGCMAGRPLEGNLHLMSLSDTKRDYMVCQRYRYEEVYTINARP